MIDAVCGKRYYCNDALHILSSYYRPLAKYAQNFNCHNIETREFMKVHAVFTANPTVPNACRLAEMLIFVSEFFDSLAIVLGSLSVMECSFYLVCLIVCKYYSGVSQAERDKFDVAVQTFGRTFRIRSRELCMKRIQEKKLDIAFCLALAETSDAKQLSHLEHEFE
jgi:hypothetical protein